MSRRSESLNKQVRGDDLVPVASAARVANGDSGWLNAEEYASLALTANCTAESGSASPTLTIIVETASDNAGTNARNCTGTQFSAIVGVAAQRQSFTGLDKFYRVRYTITGTTPSFTFSVAGEGK